MDPQKEGGINIPVVDEAWADLLFWILAFHPRQYTRTVHMEADSKVILSS